MKGILEAKWQQSDVFRQTLTQIMDRDLIHNVETDDFWGCGEDGLGANVLGILLEELHESPPILTTSSHTQDQATDKPPEEQASATTGFLQVQGLEIYDFFKTF